MSDTLTVDSGMIGLSLQRPDAIDIRGLKRAQSRVLAALTNNAIFTLFEGLSNDPRFDGLLSKHQAREWLLRSQEGDHKRKGFIWIQKIWVPGIQLEEGIQLDLRFEDHTVHVRKYNRMYGQGAAQRVVGLLRSGLPCRTTLYRAIRIDPVM